MFHKTEITHCILCSSADAEVLSETDRHGDPLRTVICVRCGLVRSQPIPTAADIQQFYALDYRQAYMRTYQPTPRLTYRAGLNAMMRWRDMRDIWIPGQQVLDIGAGGGEFLFVLRHMGVDARGLEPNQGYGTYAAQELNLPIELGFAEEATFAEQSFDVITLYHILEHFRDPLAIVRRVHGWLRTGGCAVIEVPNVEATCQAPNHRFHKAHLYNFNLPTLELLCRQAGLVVQRSWFSDDGGTVTVQASKSDALPPFTSALPGNCARIQNALRQHTWWKHYTSRYPYQRPLQKIRQYADEWLATRRNRAGQRLLLQMVKELKAHPFNSSDTVC